MKSQKEIKAEYKQLKQCAGVFQIRNLTNQKIFIGRSPDLRTVWNSQKFKLENGLHPNFDLQKDWKELGQSRFVFEIISELKDTEDTEQNMKEELKSLEELYIDELKPFGSRGYNKMKT